MIAIIDYDAGNIRSVEKAVQHLGRETVLTRDPKEILDAEGVILPGVGAFGDAMERIRHYGLEKPIKQATDTGKPFLGICLGLQLLFEESEESPGIKGLGILRGKIRKLPANNNLKVPNIGWNSLEFPRKGKLFRNMSGGTFVYFVHSYYLEAESPEIVTATIDYGVTVHAAVESGNIFATQFHPEKSSAAGLKILDSFLGCLSHGSAI
ncbi:MAG: imidazole glycerol phosphate synthase subunit HisH [Lachnospiraceae bacterium]|nr:imidazole glycerol phosphate synthase subunit HisH [Lachnospiraceae bacterium]